MIAYIVRKLLYGVLILWGVATVIFLLFTILPSDGARATLGQRSDIASLEAVKKELGLDKPKWQQYLLYLNDISPLGFIHESHERIDKYSLAAKIKIAKYYLLIKAPYLRTSYQSKEEVSSIIARSFPNTAILAILSLGFALFIGITAGVISALRKDTWLDVSLIIVAAMGIALPSFFSSLIISWLFGFVFSDLTHLNMQGSLFEYKAYEGRVLAMKNLILPVLTLGIRPLSVITQLTRSSMLDVIKSDYLRTARAKGLSEKTIVFKHALRNSINPVVTAVSGWMASLLGGAFFVEFIFNWKGLGKVTIDALNNSDFPVVMGSVLFISFIFIVINLLVDIIYGIVDPRIRLS